MHIIHLLCLFLLSRPCLAVSPGTNHGSSDELTLLSFKSLLLEPAGWLVSWNSSNYLCSWRGVVCSRRHLGRVVALHMNSFSLAGCISPFVGNLSSIRELDFSNNTLEGQMPEEFGQLRRHQVLNLTRNLLAGSIPTALGRCTQLVYIDLHTNHLLQEYGAGNMVSTHGDICSYGILILEMVTGRRPTEITFGHELGVRNYVEMAFKNRVEDIISMELVTELNNVHATLDATSNRKKMDSLISLLKLGMLCSKESPSSRMSTKDIIKEIHAIKKALA